MRYVVGVGGTGQHIALALVDYYVLAHSLVPQPLDVPSFLLLDADPSGAWSVADDQLQFLRNFGDRRGGFPDPKRRSVVPAGHVGLETAAQWLTERFSSPEAARRLLSEEQAAIKVVDGYFGEPRVAAMLTDLLIGDISGAGSATDPLRHLSEQMSQAGARVCVVGSAVGGTGAGVIPRLVNHLASRPNRVAHLCAVVGLRWFRLENGSDVYARMQANYIACLWHQRKTLQAAPYRLVLWGHPRPDSATEEANSGPVRQGVKVNLGLPWTAAAAAQAFLVAPAGSDELENAIVAPVGQRRDTAQIAACLGFGDASLGALVKSNQDFIGRLNHLERYLIAPFDGPIAAPFFQSVRVKQLDGLDQLSRERLLRELRATRKAKQEALVRLDASDPDFAVGKPRVWRGVEEIRRWVSAGASLRDIAGDLTKQGPQAGASSDAVMLPPEAVREGASFSPTPAGRRAVIEAAHVNNLMRFEEVLASRIPDVAGIAMLLREAIEHDLYWNVGGGRLPDLLMNGTQPEVPAALGSVGSDSYVAWVQRWFILLAGLLSGRVSAVPLAQPMVVGDTRIVYDLLYGHHLIGSLDPDLAVLPNLSSFWGDAGAVTGLARAVGVVRGYATPWVAVVAQAGRCKTGRVPRWVDLLEAALNVGDAPVRRSPPCSTQPSLLVRWPTDGAPEEVHLPLPASAGANAGDLVADTLSAFGIPVEQVLAGAEPAGLAADALSSWRELMGAVHRVQLLSDDPQGEWARATEAQVLWGDQISRTAARWLTAALFVPPRAGRAFQAQPGFLQLTVDDLVTDSVAAFVTVDGSRAPLLPVRGRFAPLIDVGRSSVQVSDEGVKATLHIVGRAPATVSIRADRVRRLPNTDLLFWPKVMSKSAGHHHLLLRPAHSLEFRVGYSVASGEVTSASPWCRQGASEFFFTFDAAPSLDLKPSFIELVDTREARQPLGLAPLRDLRPAQAEQAEFWAVDFGTSSSVVCRRVVAAQGSLSDAVPVRASAASDATLALSKYGVARDKLIWFSTWDNGPKDLGTNLIPSVVVVRSHDDTPDEPRQGEHFTLDHGVGKPDVDLIKRIAADLKWAQGRGARYRVPYLVALLQQAIAFESAAARPVARRIEMTFTLPLRQRDDLKRFAHEISYGPRSVVAQVEASTGVTIVPHYEWESRAVAPRHLDPGMVILVADLGGGTLDLYAQWRPLAADTAGEFRSMESAYLGGHRLVELLREEGYTESPHALRRSLRSLSREEKGRLELRHQRPIEAYFSLLHRYVLLWLDGLRSRWDVPVDQITHVALAGMGWNLPGAPPSSAEYARGLQAVAQQLGLALAFQSYASPQASDDEERKINLARASAMRVGRDADALLEEAANCHDILGLPVVHQGKRFAASDDMAAIPLAAGRLVLDYSTSDLKRLWGGFSQLENFNAANTRLKEAAHPGDPLSGALRPMGNALQISPLTCAAEEALRLIQGGHTP